MRAYYYVFYRILQLYINNLVNIVIIEVSIEILITHRNINGINKYTHNMISQYIVLTVVPVPSN